MCCFSQPVRSVHSTNIFARPAEERRQFLVYSMTLDAGKELSMILPLPVKTPAAENDVEFIDLEGYPNFFADLEQGFPNRRNTKAHGKSASPATAATLRVLQVGSFEASFVPTITDFSRLDGRFRLPQDVWDKLPAYKTYGFAVFKLKPGAMTVHPMAFSFPRQNINALFFPTVHIHDGKVHSKAGFDHTLFCQPTPEQRPAIEEWQESYTHPTRFMRIDQTRRIILPDQHCYKREMHGSLPNRDTFLEIQV